MTPEEIERRIGRLEAAVNAVARAFTRIAPLRPSHDGAAGVEALQAIDAEVRKLEQASATEGRRERLQAELAELGS